MARLFRLERHKKSQRKGSVNAHVHNPNRRRNGKTPWRRSVSENIHLDPGRPDRGEEQNNLQGESDGSCSTPLRESSLYDGEAKDDFWSITGDFIYRHHVEPRGKLYVPKEETFPVPTKYIDVTRTTNTTFDVMLEKVSFRHTGEWLQEFRENLVDDRVLEHRDSHEVRIWVNTVFILISLKDRSCEICQRTKITRAPCRRRNGEAVPRAEKIGDL